MKDIEIRAISLSLLAHIVLFYSLAITFKEIQIAKNPILSFLGPILDKNDFTNLKSNTNSQKLHSSIALPIVNPQSQFYPDKAKTQKPIARQRFGANVKTFHKETFLDQIQEQNSINLKADRLLLERGIPLQSPKRIPLKLFQK